MLSKRLLARGYAGRGKFFVLKNKKYGVAIAVDLCGLNDPSLNDKAILAVESIGAFNVYVGDFSADYFDFNEEELIVLRHNYICGVVSGAAACGITKYGIRFINNYTEGYCRELFCAVNTQDFYKVDICENKIVHKFYDEAETEKFAVRLANESSRLDDAKKCFTMIESTEFVKPFFSDSSIREKLISSGIKEADFCFDCPCAVKSSIKKCMIAVDFNDDVTFLLKKIAEVL